MRSRSLANIVVLGTLLVPSLGLAQVQSSGPEAWPGKNAVGVSLGFQTGIGSYTVSGHSAGPGLFSAGGPPNGFKLLFNYNFRVRDEGAFTLWLDFGANFTIGSGCSYVSGNNFYACGYASNGDTIEPLAGVRLKFRTPIPLVPYARADATVIGVFNRYCGDNALAFGARLGGGANYYVLKWLGLGLDMGFTLGPGFYFGNNANQCPDFYYGSHVEFYATYDLSVGAEFIF
jgi:hypothetical protein